MFGNCTAEASDLITAPEGSDENAQEKCTYKSRHLISIDVPSNTGIPRHSKKAILQSDHQWEL